MKNNDDVIQSEVIQDAALDDVAGGLRLCVPRNEGNMREVTQKQIDAAWERVKEKMGWKFKNRELDQKDRELDMQAKKMWIDAAFNLPDVIGKITGLFKGGA